MRMSLFLRSTTFACSAIIVGSTLNGCSGRTSAGPTPTAPAITTQPASQTVSPRQTATSTVAATGTPPFSHHCQKNGASFTGAKPPYYMTPAATPADHGAQSRVGL